jgi:hypothetical protein
MVIAAAGPASNLVLAIVSALVVRLVGADGVDAESLGARLVSRHWA